MIVPTLMNRVLDRDNMVEDDNGDKYLRAVLVCVAHTLIFGSDRIVEGWVWALVEDLDVFNSFLWGAYCYRIFEYHMRNGGRVRGKKWHLYGPAWALLVWAMEHIPDLGGEVGNYSGNHRVLPRCLRWTFRTKPKTNRIDLQPFFETHGREIWDMRPEVEKMATEYYTSSVRGVALGVRFRKPTKMPARGRRPDRTIDSSRPSEDSMSVARYPSRSRGSRGGCQRRGGRVGRTVVEEVEEEDEGLRDVQVGFGKQPRASPIVGDVGKHARDPLKSSSSSSRGAQVQS